MNSFTTEHGDILPFRSIIRVMNCAGCLRVMFVNGSVDIIGGCNVVEFMEDYMNWLRDM